MPDSDERYTPEHVLDVVREYARGPIAFDPCTTSDNRTRATIFRHKGGLDEDWTELVCRDGVIWVNPPYSRGQLIKWTSKCTDTRGVDRIELIPSDLGSKAGALAASTCDALCFVRGRLTFETPAGKLKAGAKQPSIIVYWGDRSKRFARVFSQLGVVWRR